MRQFFCQQGSPEWFELRRGVPTASEFNRIMTPEKMKPSSAMDGYVAELIGELVRTDPAPPDRMNDAMRHGVDVEPEARRFYEMHRNCDVTKIGFCMSDDMRFGCSPDGLIGDDGLLELKCPDVTTQIKYLMGPAVVPSEYRCQVHGQLIVTGRKWVDFLSYARGPDPFLVRIEADSFTTELRVCLELFWEKLESAKKRFRVEKKWPEPSKGESS